MASSTMEVGHHNVVSHAEWLAARSEFLTKEKEFTRLRDELSRQRRALPWEKVEKRYEFDSTNGQGNAGRSFRRPQPAYRVPLHVRPGLGGGLPKLFLSGGSFRRLHHPPRQSRHHAGGGFTRSARRDRSLQEAHGLEVSVGLVVRQRFQFRLSRFLHAGRKGRAARCTTTTPWASSPAKRVREPASSPRMRRAKSFTPIPAMRAGLDILVGAYNFLDLVPKGRDEDGLAFTMAWVRHHDRYTEGYFVDPAQKYEQPKSSAGSCCSGESHS